ncbi:MAG: phospholipase D-like domain-containing protein, partial [Firmicutes bacterium]|nr:phospholipase D-like domain-containing protein [Bacillota bacterium]
MTDVRLITSGLGNELIDAMATADTIYLIVSFAANSGIGFLQKALAQAVARHAEIKILVGDYLYITEPGALQRLYQLQQEPPSVQPEVPVQPVQREAPQLHTSSTPAMQPDTARLRPRSKPVAPPDPARPPESFQARETESFHPQEADFEIRLWQSQGRSFHPKAYLLQMGPDDGLLFVGSSNLSRSALTSGVEWNLAMRAQVAPLTFDRARQTFLESFYAACTLPVTPGVIDLYRAGHDRYHREFPQTALQWRRDQAKVPASDDGDDGDGGGHGPKRHVNKTPRPPVQPDAPPPG